MGPDGPTEREDDRGGPPRPVASGDAKLVGAAKRLTGVGPLTVVSLRWQTPGTPQTGGPFKKKKKPPPPPPQEGDNGPD